jgi:hypothetical protein
MPRGQILVVNLPRKGRNGAVFIGHACNGIPGYVLANPRRLDSPRPGGGTWDREESLAMYLRDLRGLSDRTRAVALWYDRPLAAAERDAMRAELNRIYQVVAAGGTVMLDHFCRSGNVSVPCTGDMIAQVVNEALDAREVRRAAAG